MGKKKDLVHLQDLIDQMNDDIWDSLEKIAAEANRQGTAVSVQLGPSYENIYLVNPQFMSENYWEESDLQAHGVERGDWITSNQMDY